MPDRLHIKQIISTMLLAMPLCCASAAHATTGLWMMLGDGDKLESGSKPDRVMHYANAARIKDRTDQNAKIAEITRNPDPKTINARIKAIEIKEMDVVEIYENPKAPGLKMLTMQFQCAKKLFRVAKAEAKERNSLHRFSGATEWQKYVPTAWQSRAYFVACFPEVWEPIVKADNEEMNRTKKVPKQSELRNYGVGRIGNWTNTDGLNQVYRLTWDKIWAGSATPTPFHHNRTAAEEQEYQAWKKGNDAILAANEKAAPEIVSTIDGMEGQVKDQLQGLDREKVFQEEIARNFKNKNKYYGTLKGLTETQLMKVRGVPTLTSDRGNLRLLVYSYVQDNRQEEIITDDKGNAVGSNLVGSVYNCNLTFNLRVGGNQPEYRVVDYSDKCHL